MKNVLFACMSIFLLALAFHLGATEVESQNRQPMSQYVSVSTEIGKSFDGWSLIGVIVTGSGQVFEYAGGHLTYVGNLNAIPTSAADVK